MARRFYFEPPQPAKPKVGAGLKSLLVRCPSTSKLTDTGRTVKETLWADTELKPQKLSCPHCGEVHNWTKGDVVLGRPLG